MAMSEQPVDLKRFLKVFWRKRLIVCVFVIVGLLCGVAHVALRPPLPAARALVVVPTVPATSSSGAPVDDTPTQIIIATSAPVLAAAGAAVSPSISPSVLRRQITVTALSADVLQFQVSAPTAAEAEKLANAEVTGYIAYINRTNVSNTGGVVSALRNDASNLSNQIESLQHQINSVTAELATENPGSAAGQRDASLIGSLRTEQQGVSLQLDAVNNEIVSNQVSGSLSAQATRLLQPAAIVPTSKLQIALYPVAGALVGLLLGGLFIFLRSRRDRRLRYRDELASAINLPVLASVECERCRSVNDWRAPVGGIPTFPG